MKKNNGFTLIELLAVIVILAIIALIASPIIIGLIDDARKESFKNTAYGIVKAGELLYAQDLLKGINEEVTFTYTDGVESSSVGEKELKYNGQKPKNGAISINSEGKVLIIIHNGNYCAEKGYNDSEIILTEKSSEECNIIIGYTDTTGASMPELSDGMIPIRWDGTKWIKANINEEWYNYENKEWANSVLVTESSRSTYQSAAAGTEVLENDVLAYLVWIPRYRYKLFNVDYDSIASDWPTIEIEFESKGTSKSNGTTNGSWLTHPAFTFGTTELSGLWVGKFETTGNATTPTVKPGIVSLRNQNMSTKFTTSQKFNITSTYGLTSINDTHVMKSMEWGAVSYLTISDYGVDGYISNNPSQDSLTGCAGEYPGGSMASSGCPSPYTTPTGQTASTTGNVYGIYDMVGGGYEIVMGAMYNSDNTTIAVENSGFTTGFIDNPSNAKYIDKYLYGTTSGVDADPRAKLGDGFGEAYGWYGNDAIFVYPSYPWFCRGGYYDDWWAGIFTYLFTTGDSGFAFRIVLLGGN